jgi:hypothetical protein
MFKLTDLIELSGVKLHDFKVHCATGIETRPLEAFLDGTWKEWQERQNQRNFECKRIVSLIHLGSIRWLFAGVFDVLGIQHGNKHNPNGFMYSTKEVAGLEHLTGRAIVEFKKTFRASYLRGEKHKDQLLVAAVQEQRMTVGDFPGFNGILLSFATLRTVIRERIPTWHAALSNVAGIYVITDNHTGKQYIGAAYGGVGIWQRWSSYAQSGHGGNNELKVLLGATSIEYAQNFQFSLLEVCDLNSSNDFIFSRERHWKNVLRTREFGLNSN